MPTPQQQLPGKGPGAADEEAVAVSASEPAGVVAAPGENNNIIEDNALASCYR